ncbi:MAG TPA: cell division protein ZapA, partial [Elusimicrobiales bacterium]|nr:cell division protein ZapA [Elusimicrobiales bacterium]
LHGMLFEDIAVEGLTPMDISLVAKMVNDRVKALEKECMEGKSAGIDTLRLALLTAFDFASELYLLQQESGLAGKATAKRIDTVLDQLQKTLGPGRE